MRDHLKDAQVHRDRSNQHKAPYGKWVLAIVFLVLACGGIAAYSQSQGEKNQSEITRSISTTVVAPQTISTIVLDNQLENISQNALTAVPVTLNPLGKLSYEAYGQMQILYGCLNQAGGTTCPTVFMAVANQTGITGWGDYVIQHKNSVIRLYGEAEITGAAVTEFTLKDLDYDGKYFFGFAIVAQTTPPIPAVIISLSLMESWSVMQTVTQSVHPFSLTWIVAACIPYQSKPFVTSTNAYSQSCMNAIFGWEARFTTIRWRE